MKSLHSKLFFRYAALIFPIIVIFMVILYIILGNTLQKNATSELQADCDNISTLLDTQMEQIDELSKRIVSSDPLHSYLVRDLYSHDIDSYNNKLAFSTTLFDIIKLSFNHMSLNIADIEGHYIYVGNNSIFSIRDPESFHEISWFNPTLLAYGKKKILPPHIPELNSSETPVVSLCRAFSPDDTMNQTAVLELQLEYSYLDKKIKNALHNQKEIKHIYVYDSGGTLVYPYEARPPQNLKKRMLELARSPESAPQSTIYQTRDNASTLFACHASDFTNWTVFVTAEESKIFASFYQFRTLLITASFLLLILLLFITWQIANKMTIPLKKLEQTAHALTFDNLSSYELPDYKSTFKELDSLYRSFEQMQQNLQDSLQDAISAHTMAADAKMLALQSQMNPHFLYNTLASISILAEDGENEQAVKMCDSLSVLLRYMSSNSSMDVALWQELEHLRSYIYLIKVKYGERIQFHINMDDSLSPIKVPRLLIQPLVENCIKYALNVDPPWVIHITGYIKDSCWVIQVKDNGSGFPPDFLDSFHKKVLEIDWKKPLPELSINGMGILNLYMRLFLKYKQDLIFSLDNLPGNGACVTIGGPLTQNIGDKNDEKLSD
ncbi:MULTISPECIES: sensor histidine kinase [Clostridia]|uniref:sensor histidine kinase n=1 Tax=Clostridia TaxID=186801 RepID=UPI00067E9052|nr:MULTISPECIES: sensor histidine kinase [Clostridia]